jgi:hypothetical protein
MSSLLSGAKRVIRHQKRAQIVQGWVIRIERSVGSVYMKVLVPVALPCWNADLSSFVVAEKSGPAMLVGKKLSFHRHNSIATEHLGMLAGLMDLTNILHLVTSIS